MVERAAPSRGVAWFAAILVVVVLTVYFNSLMGAFVFDDTAAIVDNPTIRHLGALSDVLSPPREAGQTVGGRPLVNLTLAINYAVGGTDPRGYHWFNVLVHALAALTLFGLVRSTLQKTHLTGSALPLAFASSLLWAVHPLLTESVTYVIQRAESLVGLWYLLTLYAFARGTEAESSPKWLGLAWVAGLLGMATKEVMATAPIAVLLYDRVFVAGSWGNALRARGKFHAALAATWLLLGALVFGADHRGGTAGFGAGDSPWTYALTQTRAITQYLCLAFWPQPLVFDYGTAMIERVADAWPYAVVVCAGLVATVVALRRWPMVGFAAAMFFLILAPSSSVVPIAVQPLAEHRMYLPLAAVAVLVVVALHRWLRRWFWVVVVPVVVALGGATIARNQDYRTATALWRDTVAKQPGNARAHGQLAEALAVDGQREEALAEFTEAIRLEVPNRTSGRSLLGEFQINYGNALLATGRVEDAVRAYQAALAHNPGLKLAHYNLGSVWLGAGQLAPAAAEFSAALQLDPNYASAHTNLGTLRLRQNRATEALVHYETALRLEPSAKALTNLGLALQELGRTSEAIAHWRQALALDPGFAPAKELLDAQRAVLPAR